MDMRISWASFVLPTAAAMVVSPPSSSLPTVPNFRDLGSMPCADGRVVRSGLLWRSATPANISDADAATVSPNALVLDLRAREDAEKDAGARRLAEATQHVPLISEAAMRKGLMRRATPLQLARLLLLGAAKKLSPSRRLRLRLGTAVDIGLCTLLDQVRLADVYWLIMSERAEFLKEALELCAEQLGGCDGGGGGDGDGGGGGGGDAAAPILVHCTHGKDRTGVVVALLLSMCGVSEADILADYARSHECGCTAEPHTVHGSPCIRCRAHH